MAVELATAYVSIVPDTSKIAPGVRKALTGVDGQAAAAGKSAGSKMSAALGTALKGGALAAGTAAAAGIGVALTKGFQRLSAIDDAKGKLEGLGHTTQSTSKIMDSALASVKGTAYGLGDAATIAASAVAAGVKPGQQLTKYLSSIGDAASIAGTGLSEMGLIFNQVQTGQAAYTDDLNQLASRGIPIYQWLAEEAKISAGEVKKLASEGKISSEMFFNAINKNIGGAALSAGKTVRGSFQNMLAAMGRLGAAAEQPFFKRLPGTFTSATAAIDAMTPRVTELATQLDSKIFDEWGPKLQKALESARDSGKITDLVATVRGLWSAMEGLGPAAGTIVTELGRASSAIGVGTWQLFLAALNAGVGVLNLMNPLLSTTAHLMEDNRSVVTALMAAWVAFKTVPSLLERASGPISALTAQMKTAQGGVRGFSDAYRQSVTWMAQANPQMSRAGVHMSVLTANAKSAAGAIGGGLKSAVSGLSSAFGGPVGLGIAAVTVGLGAVISSEQRYQSELKAVEDASKRVTAAQTEMAQALIKTHGVMDESTMKIATEQIDGYRKKVEAASVADGKWHTAAADTVINLATLGAAHADVAGQQDRAASSAKASKEALDRLGLSSEDVAKKLYGSGAEYFTLSNQLKAMGAGGIQAAEDLSHLRSEYLAQVGVAKRVTPGVGELAEAARTLGDKSASAADKLSALRAAVDALSPARGKIEAMRQYGETVRQVTEAAAGIDSTAFKADGSLNDMSESAGKLTTVLGDLVDKSLQVASQGGDMGQVARQNEQAFQQLAKATNRSVDDIKALFNEMGGNVVDVAVKVSGAPEVRRELTAIRAGMDKANDGKIEVKTGDITTGTINTLKALGIEVKTMPDGKTIQIEANDKTKNILDTVGKKVDGLNSTKVTIPTDLNVLPFNAKDQQVRAQLTQLKSITADPKADLVIDQLLANKQISADQLAILNNTVAEAKGKLNTDQLIPEIARVKALLDQMAAARTVQVSINQTHMGFMDQPGAFQPDLGHNADGSIRQYAAGGIALAEAYANGGTRLPDRALIQKPDPKGGLVQWAEPETGGEAFIPLASRKRKRSTDILGAVADIFGFALVPKDSISATLGDAISGSVAGLAKRAGLDRVTKFADGGITADKLKQYMQGADGATYILGGWGQGYNTDCSGEQSVAAEATKGNMSPGTGTRSGTAGFSSYLPSQGYTTGTAPAGVPAHEIGWSSEHASGTIFDPVGGDVNFEMGGQNGGGAYGGGAVSSRDGQFPNHAWKRLADAVVAASPGTTDTTPDTTTLTPGTTTTTPTTTDQPTTFSGRLGGAAGAFVSGQLQSLFGVLGVNDSPGALAALSEAERQRQQKNGDDKSIRDAVQKGADPKKLREAQDKVTDTERSLSIAQQRLREVEANPKSSESSKLAAKARVEKLERELAQARADLETLKKQIKNTPPTIPQTGDTGVGSLTGVAAVKELVRRALNPRGWGSGEQWAATDWIAQHESSWNPKARNGKYSGTFQLGPDAWAAAGIEPTDDPAKQAEAYAHYVAGRYKVPTAAKAFWEANNWYDRGGIAPDVGLMVKNTNRPERVLSPQQTQSFEQMVKRDFQSGVGTDQVIAKLDQIVQLLAHRDGGDIHNHFPDYGSAKRDAEEVSRDQRQRALLGGL